MDKENDALSTLIKTNNFLNPKPPSNLCSFILLLISLSTCILSITIFNLINVEYNDQNANKIIYVFGLIRYQFCLFFAIWAFLNALLSFISLLMYKKEKLNNFLALYIMNQQIALSVVWSIYAFSFIHHFFLINKVQHKNENPQKRHDEKNNFIFENTIFEIEESKANQFVYYIGVVLLAFIFENMIRQYLKYNIFIRLYKEKLELCTKNYSNLVEINKKLIDKNVSSHLIHPTKLSHNYCNIEKYDDEDIKMIFNEFMKQNHDNIDYLTKENFQNLFECNEMLSNASFNLLDINNDNKITTDEFVLRYKNIRSQYNNTIINMHKSKQTIDDLKIITLPLTLYISLNFLETTSNLKTVASLFGTFFSLSFIIGPVISDVLKNIFSIYFSRPFDIGDVVIFKDNIYKVKDLGFYYTTMDYEDKEVAISNMQFKKFTITNFKDNTIYKARLSIELKNIEELKHILDDFFTSRKGIYENDYKITNFSLKENIKKCDIVFGIFMHEVNLNFVEELKDELVKFLYDHEEILSIKSVSYVTNMPF